LAMLGRWLLVGLVLPLLVASLASAYEVANTVDSTGSQIREDSVVELGQESLLALLPKDYPGGVFNAGLSFIVNQRKKGPMMGGKLINTEAEQGRSKVNSTLNSADWKKDFTESYKTTSNSTFFDKFACDEDEFCLQAFADKDCGGSPIAQMGIPSKAWKKIGITKKDCTDAPQSAEGGITHESCDEYNRYYISAQDDGKSVQLKMATTRNGTKAELVIPEINVGTKGQCFSKCATVLHHPKIRRIAEVMSDNDADFARRDRIVEFARDSKCDCCDFEQFIQGSCKIYDYNKTANTFIQMGNGWAKGPTCFVPKMPSGDGSEANCTVNCTANGTVNGTSNGTSNGMNHANHSGGSHFVHKISNISEPPNITGMVPPSVKSKAPKLSPEQLKNKLHELETFSTTGNRTTNVKKVKKRKSIDKELQPFMVAADDEDVEVTKHAQDSFAKELEVIDAKKTSSKEPEEKQDEPKTPTEE